MTARPEEGDRILAMAPSGELLQPGELLQLMIYIANLRTPNERWPEGIRKEEMIRYVRRLRERTQKYWPGLWQPVEKDELPENAEGRAQRTLEIMRGYLHRFWREPDERARDWYIHRAREYYQRHFVLSKTSEPRKLAEQASTVEDARNAMSWLRIDTERMLDEPPQRNMIEDALYELQQRGRGAPSKRPLYCQNPRCEKPYFLSERKGTKFCSRECQRPSLLVAKRNYWNTKRRKK